MIENAEFIKKIWDSEDFQNIYKKLFLISAAKAINFDEICVKNNKINDLFDSCEVEHKPLIEELDTKELNYLISVAPIFSNIEDKEIQEATLRIAQYAVLYGSNSQKQAGYMILDMLVNKPSIDLARQEKLISEEDVYNLPLSFNLGRLNREEYYNIEIDKNDNFYATKFQRMFWDEISGDNNLLSLSAPTSSGKSFVVIKWLKQKLELQHVSLSRNIAIIVPTRALINQFESDFKKELFNYNKITEIITVPFTRELETNKTKKIYIFTQERMSIFLSNSPQIIFDAVFVDEAHKISDGTRGILLQNTVELLIKKNNKTKVIFASPFTRNPEKVFMGVKPIKTQSSVVNQNIFYVTQLPDDKKKWSVKVLYNYKKEELGHICFDKELNTIKTKMANIVYKIGNETYGNLIYADDGSKAETYAEELYQLIPDNEICEDEDINNLINLCKDVVHKKFILIKFLKKRIAFHYGSMPHILRLEIERLYKKKSIKYLFCTSTLLEGVNLACKNIFMRDPKKGDNNMEAADVFNLSGRAGRLKKEFFGNIFFVDWDKAPTKSKEQEVSRATENLLRNNFEEILEAYDLGTLNQAQKSDKDVLSMSGYLFSKYLNTRDISKCKEVSNACTKEQIEELNEALNKYSNQIKLPQEMLRKHPTMYHYSMQLLLNRFNEKYKKNAEEAIKEIIPLMPDENDYKKVYQSLIETLLRINKFFKTDFGSVKAVKYAALISSKWMFGYQISRLISERVKYLKESKTSKKEHFNTTVRKVFKDVEQIARYQVPRFLSCYIDTLNYFFKTIQKEELSNKGKNIGLYLEFGVSEKTQVSMILLGLSRATIASIANVKINGKSILPKGMNEQKSLDWLKANLPFLASNLNKQVSKIQIEEINDVLSNYSH